MNLRNPWWGIPIAVLALILLASMILIFFHRENISIVLVGLFWLIFLLLETSRIKRWRSARAYRWEMARTVRGARYD